MTSTGNLEPIPILVEVFLAALVLTAAVYDWRFRSIPNWLTVGGLAVALILRGLSGSWPGLWIALQGFGLAAFVYVVLYVMHGVGGGDVKLMAAVGAAAGLTHWFNLFLFTSITGGIVALIVIVTRRRFWRTLRNIVWILWELVRLRAPHKRSEELDVDSDRAFRMPHAISIAVGTNLYLALIRLVTA